MNRHVTAHLTLESAGAARIVLAIAAARGPEIDESLRIIQGGRELPAVEVDDAHGTRLHEVAVGVGEVEVEYRATVGEATHPAPSDPVDAIRYLRPSRYCESDLVMAEAVERFGHLEPPAALAAVRAWVNEVLAYTPGASLPTDGAVATLLSRSGVCRDFAHLTVALLRALDIPARVTAVYAPGLSPMDFHAVAEAWVLGGWHVVDATGLAPRRSLVRIATGRDAADTAFLTTIGDPVSLESMEVTAVADVLPAEDPAELVTLV